MDYDLEVRVATFDWLSTQTRIHGDVLPRSLLEKGFTFKGNQIHLVAPQGIFKPKILDLPLSIATTPLSPYEDSFGTDGLLRYKYRGTDPYHKDNVLLRKTIEKSRPLVYFHGIVPGKYLAIWPVYIVGDEPRNLSFKVAVDDMTSLALGDAPSTVIAEQSLSKRTYLTSVVRQRLHQRSFREKVLQAYRSQCAFCRLRHRELLDASHIIPDHIPESEPSVNNGMALCKLHHAAFDSLLLGVTVEYVITVREDVLKEEDGPILLHGLQELHQKHVFLPSGREDWPSREALEWRYEQFQMSL